jgi:hypothetical protein
MEKTSARLFSKVLGSEMKAKEQEIVFRLENSDGQPEILSMPIGESLALVEMVAAHHGATFPVRQGVETPALTVKWFEFGRDQNQNLVLVLTLSSGGKLTFSIPRGLDSSLREMFIANASLPPLCFKAGLQVRILFSCGAGFRSLSAC